MNTMSMLTMLAVKTTPIISFNWTMLMILITFVVLFLILKKFFFEKVHNFMVAREQKVRTAFDNADSVNKVAEQRLLEYDDKLKGIEVERREILIGAKNTADDNAREIIAEAEARAAAIITQAEQEIEREKQRAIEDMRQQIAMLSLLAAEKIIEKNLDEKDQDAIIDRVIKETSKQGSSLMRSFGDN